MLFQTIICKKGFLNCLMVTILKRVVFCLQEKGFTENRLTRKDEEWNKFVNKLVDRHLERFDDVEESTRFNKWLVDHLIGLSVERFSEAENFLIETMQKHESAVKFAEFLKSFGERGESLKKFEKVLNNLNKK